MVVSMEYRNQSKKISLYIVCFALALGVFVGWKAGIPVYAAEEDFQIEAVKLPTDDVAYNVQVSVKNSGKDWEGRVRLMTCEEYRYPSSYDTIISLPEGSEKQFVVRIPIQSLGDNTGTIRISLWDKKSEKVAEKEFKRFLAEDADVLAMGILSDDFSALTYLDMGGDELYYYGNEYPLMLTGLSQGSIVDSLESFDFLVIDTYNTGILTEEELKAIEIWNYEGGVLIVGTGKYAQDTLSGIGEDFLGMKCSKVFAPDEIEDYMYQSEEIDYSYLSMAQLQDLDGRYYEQYFSKAYVTSYGEGAIGILPYSLTEVAEVEEEFYQNIMQEDFTRNLIEEISSSANARYNHTSSYNIYDNIYVLERLLRMIGNVNSPLNFTVLNILVVVYVIFVGPILYLILRAAKKRDLYWVTVPVTALAGVILISFAGRGFEVKDAKVYSVNIENLSGKADSKTYLYCYDAGHREWDLQLQKDFDYAGAMTNETYVYDADEDAYYYHVTKEGERISFGINPSSNFEDSYFIAGKSTDKNAAEGTLESDGIHADISGISGTVTNRTEYDFLYFAVVSDDTLYVYENLSAGETCKLKNRTPVYNSYQGYDMWSSFVYDFLLDIYDDNPKEADQIAALGVGLCTAYPRTDLDTTVVIGVTDEWVNAVDDDCNETSYACLYITE